MNSLRKLKMKKAEGVLESKKDVMKVRLSLEKKTAKDFSDFTRSKQKVREEAHVKYLD